VKEQVLKVVRNRVPEQVTQSVVAPSTQVVQAPSQLLQIARVSSGYSLELQVATHV